MNVSLCASASPLGSSPAASGAAAEAVRRCWRKGLTFSEKRSVVSRAARRPAAGHPRAVAPGTGGVSGNKGRICLDIVIPARPACLLHLHQVSPPCLAAVHGGAVGRMTLLKTDNIKVWFPMSLMAAYLSPRGVCLTMTRDYVVGQDRDSGGERRGVQGV